MPRNNVGQEWSYDPEGRPWRCALLMKRTKTNERGETVKFEEWVCEMGPGTHGKPYKPYCFATRDQALEFTLVWRKEFFPEEARPMLAEDLGVVKEEGK